MDQEVYRGFEFSANEFADNPDPRVPCVLLLDTSESMAGAPISELNIGLQQFREELIQDSLAARRVEIALITFGGKVRLESDFTSAKSFIPPTLSSNGMTPMAEAVARGMQILEDRKRTYQSNGIAYYRPWIFLITDGAPTDDAAAWQLACDAASAGERERKFSLFAIGTAEANFAKLRELSSARPPIQLKGIAFRELFKWLSNSLSSVSQSQAGTIAQLPPPTGWGEVPT